MCVKVCTTWTLSDVDRREATAQNTTDHTHTASCEEAGFQYKPGGYVGEAQLGLETAEWEGRREGGWGATSLISVLFQ